MYYNSSVTINHPYWMLTGEMMPHLLLAALTNPFLCVKLERPRLLNVLLDIAMKLTLLNGILLAIFLLLVLMITRLKYGNVMVFSPTLFQIWDMNHDKFIMELWAHQKEVYTCKWSPSGSPGGPIAADLLLATYGLVLLFFGSKGYKNIFRYYSKTLGRFNWQGGSFSGRAH